MYIMDINIFYHEISISKYWQSLAWSKLHHGLKLILFPEFKSAWVWCVMPDIHILYQMMFRIWFCMAMRWKIVMWMLYTIYEYQLDAMFVFITGQGLARPQGQNAQKRPVTHSTQVNKEHIRELSHRRRTDSRTVITNRFLPSYRRRRI